VADYRDFHFYHRARALAIRIHRSVQRLPYSEQIRRGDQLVRAANSIRNNIVEGSSGTKAEFARFLSHSIKSADEVQGQLQDLADVGLLQSEDQDLLGEPAQIAAMMVSYRKKMLPPTEGD
jgi:four helix bundle protein